MLRAVIDPNVFVSAALSPGGPPAKILSALQAGAFDLVVSPHLLDELRDVLGRPRFEGKIDPADARELIALLGYIGRTIEDAPHGPGLTPDPNDDYLVVLARSSRADVLVSGDRHLVGLEEPRPPVVTPREFLELLTV